MKNILNTADLLSLDANLKPSRRIIIIPMILFIFSVATMFFGSQINASDYICYFVVITGLVASIISLGSIFCFTQNIINYRTQETLHKHKLYFNVNEENTITNLLKEGNINPLFEMSCDCGSILTVIYSTTNKNYYIAQIFKFVPYEYIPYKDPIIFNK